LTSPLAGRRALVTAGAVRIGRRLSLEVADMGLDVAVLGGLDVLVCSAANFIPAAFAETTEEQMDATLAVNLKGPFFCAQAAAPAMAAAGFGRIVLLGDVAGLEPWPRFTAHSVAKAGVDMLTRCLAQELAPPSRSTRSLPDRS
jgi:pteridine reductase